MKRLQLWMMILVFSVLGSLVGHAAEVSEFRWATRNDAAVPFVRLILDVNKLPKLDAVVAKDGQSLKVTLEDTDGKKIAGDYSTNPEMITSLNIEQVKKDLVVSVKMPKKVDRKRIQVFPLKKDPAHNKPYRVVIDVPKSVPPPTYKTTAGLQGKVIVIDPGHGGTDTGAISPKNMYEKNVTFPIAMYLKPMLEAKGAKVILTRDGDHDVYGPYASPDEELQARVDIAEKNHADVFLSIHIDSFTRPDVGGVTAYYNPKTPFDEILAEALHERNIRVRGFGDRGERQANFYLLINSTMPATLVELGFLSNPQEEALLHREDVRKAFAETLADGLELYFERASKLG